MKNHTPKSILLVLSLFFGTSFFAQNFNITGLSMDTSAVYPCDSFIVLSISPLYSDLSSTADYYFSIQGNTFLPGPIVAGVSWGDGTNSTYTGNSTAPGTAIQFGTGFPSHSYSTPGTYTMIVSVANPSNNTNAIFTQVVSITSCSGIVYGVTSVDCNADGFIDSTLYNSVIPVELSGTNGSFYQGNLINGQLSTQNIPAGIYSVQINSAWLIANNYTIASVTPSTITINPNSATTFQIILNCITVPTFTGCTVGQVYCDFNNNGVFDSTDTGIPSAPIIIDYNGQSYFGISGPNGYYNISFPNPNNGGATVTLNAGWLSQNGYFLQNNTQTTTVTQCTQAGSVPINFAVDCDSSSVQSECVIGWVFCDANNNGILDSGEVTIPYAPVTLTGSGGSIVVFSNSNGIFNYSGYGYLGSVATVSISQYWLTQHGYSAITPIVTTTTNCNTLNPVYVGINCGTTSGCADLWSLVDPWIGYYQNQNNYIKLKWGNYGPAPAQSYTLTLTYPAGVVPDVSTISNPNYVISGNTITWTITGSNLSNFITTDVIKFSVPGGLVNGTSHIYSSTITAIGTSADCYSSNNNGSLMMLLGNSYDPNDKSVSLPTVIDPATQDEFTYTIRFQNTGSAPAQDIYIIDTLSSNLDWTTIKMIHASHDMQLIDLGNGVMKFNFPGIWLPDSTSNEPLSHGDLTYQIKEKATNGIGSQILNTAHIYFDWNPAIVTNTTFNENNVLSVSENELNKVVLMPNPFNDNINISSTRNIEHIAVYDMMGKVVYSSNFNTTNAQLNLSNLKSGVYVVTVKSNYEASNLRIVKR